jgi:hypothetical protein
MSSTCLVGDCFMSNLMPARRGAAPVCDQCQAPLIAETKNIKDERSRTSTYTNGNDIITTTASFEKKWHIQ